MGMRAGSMWPLLLAFLCLMFAGLALAVDSAVLWQARQELQVAADASVLAAVSHLADERMLMSRPAAKADVLAESRQAALWYAAQHHVLGLPLLLEPDDPETPDLVYGYFDASSRVLQPALGAGTPTHFNAAEVTGRRTRKRGNPAGLFFSRLFRLPSADVSASAQAVLDRQVIGFRPGDDAPAPVVPIALLSDPAALDSASWEAQIDKPLSQGGGQDLYVFDRRFKRWLAADDNGGDGLPEFTLHLPLVGAAPEQMANGRLLRFGSSGQEACLQQIASGIRPADLAEFQGALALSEDGLCPVSEGIMPAGPGLERMMSRLLAMQTTGEPRIWPLYLPASPDLASGGAGVMLRGFVAARIADVQLESSGPPGLTIILQPTVVVTGTAVTRADAPASPFVAKARLVK